VKVTHSFLKNSDFNTTKPALESVHQFVTNQFNDVTDQLVQTV